MKSAKSRRKDRRVFKIELQKELIKKTKLVEELNELAARVLDEHKVRFGVRSIPIVSEFFEFGEKACVMKATYEYDEVAFARHDLFRVAVNQRCAEHNVVLCMIEETSCKLPHADNLRWMIKSFSDMFDGKSPEELKLYSKIYNDHAGMTEFTITYNDYLSDVPTYELLTNSSLDVLYSAPTSGNTESMCKVEVG